MPGLNACLQVASLAEASGIPYIEKLAKVVVVVMELLEVRIPVCLLASTFDSSVRIAKRKEQEGRQSSMREHREHGRRCQHCCQYARGSGSCILYEYLCGDGRVSRDVMLFAAG